MNLDEQTKDDLKRWARKLGAYLGTFLVGGILAFSYSYYSLHGAKDRKIDRLESRVAVGADQLAELERELASMRSLAEGRPERGAFDSLQEELAGATTLKAELERKLERANGKIRDLEKSRNTWKSRFAKLEKERDELATELESANAIPSLAEETNAIAPAALDGESTPPSDAGATGSHEGTYGFVAGRGLSGGVGGADGDIWEPNGASPSSSNPASPE